MRYFSVFAGLLMLSTFPALAQVTVDMNALDQLKKPAPAGAREAAPKAVPPKPKAVKPKAPKPAPAEAAQPASGRAPTTAKAPPGFHAPLPELPGLPPPNAELAPLPPPVVSANKPATPPPAVLPTAAGTGAAAPGGLRITFGSGQGEMSPASEQSLKALVAKASRSETVSYNVLAYAQGTMEDPSTARRLSLARGLAVRSVLMSAGVPSTRIYVRALGANDPGLPNNAHAPADRVDVSVLGANAPPPDLALPPVLDTVTPETSKQDKPAMDKPTPRPGAVKTP